MPKQLKISPEIAQSFVKDMRAYHATKNKDKRTLIAARQAEALSRRGSIVSMEEVYELFERMKGTR